MAVLDALQRAISGRQAGGSLIPRSVRHTVFFFANLLQRPNFHCSDRSAHEAIFPVAAGS